MTALPSDSASWRRLSRLRLTWAQRARLSAALAKQREAWLSRQAISATPRLMLEWAASSQPSSGAKLPTPVAKYRRRYSTTRPLTVSTEDGSAPLLCRRLPVSGWVGGGGSRLGGLQAELDGGLVGLLAEAGEQVADLLLAIGDDAAGGRGGDSGGDGSAQLLAPLAPGRRPIR